MMFRLPPPPRFTLPPPPMLSSDIFDTKLLFRLSCSSIQQQNRQMPNLRLIVISCIIFLIIILLFTLLFIIIQFYRQRKSLFYNYESKSSPKTLPNNSSMNSSRSYETISSKHTVGYVESIDTSATTYSTDPSHIICHHCHQEHDNSTTSLPVYYHILDILPS